MDDKKLKAKIKAANQDLLTVIRKKNFEMEYDRHGDILYASFGRPQKAFAIDVDGDGGVITLRIKFETYEIVGFDILSFKKGFLARNQEAAKVFAPLFKTFGADDWFVKMSPSADKTKAILHLFIPKLIAETAHDLVAT